MSNIIHPTAIIEDGVIMGEGNYIGPYSVIKSGTTLGSNNVVESFVVLGEAPTTPTFGGLHSSLVIGHNNLFASHSVIQRGSGLNTSTVVGNNNNFYNHTTIAYDCKIGNNNYFVAYVGLAGNIDVGDYVTFSAKSGAAIGGVQGLSKLEIGSFSHIGAFSKVACSVPPCVLVTGGYNSKITSYNKNNLKALLKYFNITEEHYSTVLKGLLKNTSPSSVRSYLENVEFSNLTYYLRNFYNDNISIINIK